MGLRNNNNTCGENLHEKGMKMGSNIFSTKELKTANEQALYELSPEFMQIFRCKIAHLKSEEIITNIIKC